MYGTKRKSTGSRSSGKVKTDRWVRLEVAANIARKRQEEMAQNGKVRIIVKDGVPQNG